MSTLSFTKEAAQRLSDLYATPDLVAQRETTLDLLALGRGEAVIDIGCGPGFLCEDMARLTGPQGKVLGIDISPDLIDMCRGREPPAHLVYATEDARALSTGDHTFDVAVCTQVAEYIPETDALLSEISRVLRPGGRLLIMATDWDCVAWHTADADRMRRILVAWEGHCAHPRLPRVLGAKLRGAGFTELTHAVHPIINAQFTPQSYSFSVARLISDYVRRQVPELTKQTDAWMADLDALDRSGQYFFSTARTMFMARKPA